MNLGLMLVWMTRIVFLGTKRRNHEKVKQRKSKNLRSGHHFLLSLTTSKFVG